MRLLIIFLFTAFTATSITAQSGNKALFEQIGQNDLASLSEKMAAEVSFCINDNQTTVRKSDAISQLIGFLSEIGTKSCRPAHKGDSAEEGSYFSVGKLKSAKGVYRVFLYFENDEIVELRIDAY